MFNILVSLFTVLKTKLDSHLIPYLSELEAAKPPEASIHNEQTPTARRIFMNESDITICGHGSGNPSTKRLDIYASQRFSRRMKNGEDSGIVEVRRCVALNTSELRNKFHDKYKTILGRNIYNQSLRNFCYIPFRGKYYSDCSSSGCLTLASIGLAMPALNTAGIHSSELWNKVPVKIDGGHIRNPEVLKVGDAILFKGNYGRPLNIGHVEFVYEIKDNKSDSNDRVKPGVSGEYDCLNFKATVTCSVLNVRTSPGTGDIVDKLKDGEEVVISKICTYTKETDSQTYWGFSKKRKGWLCLAYTEPSSREYTVTVDALNFRASVPHGQVLFTLHKGDRILVTNTVKADGKTWGEAIVEGKRGYCCLTNYTRKTR